MIPFAKLLGKRTVLELKAAYDRQDQGGQIQIDGVLLSSLRDLLNGDGDGGNETKDDPQNQKVVEALDTFQNMEKSLKWGHALSKEVSNHPLFIALQNYEYVGGQGKELLDQVANYSLVKLEETIGSGAKEKFAQLAKLYTDLVNAHQTFTKSKPDLTNQPDMQQLVARVETSVATGKLLLACQSGWVGLPNVSQSLTESVSLSVWFVVRLSLKSKVSRV